MDENGQPVFTLDMDAQRKAVFKVSDHFIEIQNHNHSLRFTLKKRAIIIMNKGRRLLFRNVRKFT